MKITRMLFLAFFVCVTAVGWCNGNKQREKEHVYMQREPVTLELIHDIKNEITDANFYLSTSIEFFMPSIDEVRKISSGDYERVTNTVTDRVIILFNSHGKYDALIDNEQRINISFGNIILSFKRVSGGQVNRYELDSAVRNNNRMELHFPKDRPYLVIHTNEIQNKNITPAQGIPWRNGNVDSSNVDKKKEDVIYNLNVLGYQGSKLTDSDREIEAIVKFICEARKPNRIPVSGSGFDSSSVEQIVKFYFEEAKKEDINPDLAIAQMIWSMQYFSEVKSHKDFRQAHNYGRLIFERDQRNHYWDGKTFTGRTIRDRRQIGIRAHIQYLKCLAAGRLNDVHTPIVLPNWYALAKVAGDWKTLEDISKSWSPRNPKGYARNVSDVYEKLAKHLGKEP